MTTEPRNRYLSPSQDFDHRRYLILLMEEAQMEKQEHNGEGLRPLGFPIDGLR